MTVKADRKLLHKRLLHTLIAATLCTLTAPVSALSLSEIKLNSGLHQPLDASIKLRNFDPIEADRISVEIANDLIQSQYNNSNYLPAPIDASIKTTAEGSYIVLSSPRAIDEPFMKFAVQLNSPDGLILRQYEVLIDPPKSAYSIDSKQPKQVLASRPNSALHEKLKAASNLTTAQRSQGIELAPPPETAALRSPPKQVKFNAQPTIQRLGAAPAIRNALAAPSAMPAAPSTLPQEPPQVAALVRHPQNVSAPVAEKLYNSKVMNTDEFLQALEDYSFANIYKPATPEEIEPPQTAALLRKPSNINVPAEEKSYQSKAMNKDELIQSLDEYSLASIYGPAKKQQPLESDIIDPTLSTIKPEVAALSRTPEAKQHSQDGSIPAAVVIGHKSERFSVEDKAFAGNDADSIARALIAYREQIREGKKTSFKPQELMKLSASGVNRVSSTGTTLND